MAILAAMGEGEPGGVGKVHGRAMNDFGDQRQGLKRARPNIPGQQQRGEIAELALIGHGEYRAQAAAGRHPARAPRGGAAPPGGEPRPGSGRAARDQCQQRALRRLAGLHQVHDRALRLSHDGCMRLDVKSRTAAECQW